MPVIVIKCYNRRAQGLLAAASQQCPWLFLPGRICTHSVQGSPACNGGAGKKNRTSHGSLGSRQTIHACDTCDTSLETAIKCWPMIKFATLYFNRLKSCEHFKLHFS